MQGVSGRRRLGGSGLLKIVSSAPVGTRERVVVVEVADTWLVLGVTPSQVNTLHTLPAQPTAPETVADSTHSMIALFSSRLREAAGGKAQGR